MDTSGQTRLHTGQKSKRGIITIAHGKARYLNMARHLGRSLRLHAPKLPTAIVTDADNQAFEDCYDHVIPLQKEYGRNVEQKLHLDLYSPFEETLFIDADSLVAKPIDWIFDDYQAVSFTSPGYEFILPGDTDDQWHADFDHIFSELHLERLPKFNGGVYFFRKDPIADRLFVQARKIWSRYREYGIKEFRGCGPPDELLFSIAMSLEGQSTIPDHGRIMRTLIGLQGKLTLNVVKGNSQFRKDGNDVQPAIVHFASFGAYHPAYNRECLRLDSLHAGLPRRLFLNGILRPVLGVRDTALWGLILLKRRFYR